VLVNSSRALSERVRSEAFIAVTIQAEVFRVVTQCSVAVGYQRFGVPFYLHLHRSLKRRYPTTTLQGVTIQKSSIWRLPEHFRVGTEDALLNVRIACLRACIRTEDRFRSCLPCLFFFLKSHSPVSILLLFYRPFLSLVNQEMQLSITHQVVRNISGAILPLVAVFWSYR